MSARDGYAAFRWGMDDFFLLVCPVSFAVTRKILWSERIYRIGPNEGMIIEKVANM